jgi:hypothetical protein
VRPTLKGEPSRGTTAPGVVSVIEVDGVKEKTVGPERTVTVTHGYCVECEMYRDDTVITDSVAVPVDG